uniref:Retrotransposon Orf1 n=1 Tax=Angiostrongylus cantonensis TaxID=6313 RepID=A0A158PA93_ANGCA
MNSPNTNVMLDKVELFGACVDYLGGEFVVIPHQLDIEITEKHLEDASLYRPSSEKEFKSQYRKLNNEWVKMARAAGLAYPRLVGFLRHMQPYTACLQISRLKILVCGEKDDRFTENVQEAGEMVCRMHYIHGRRVLFQMVELHIGKLLPVDAHNAKAIMLLYDNESISTLKRMREYIDSYLPCSIFGSAPHTKQNSTSKEEKQHIQKDQSRDQAKTMPNKEELTETIENANAKPFESLGKNDKVIAKEETEANSEPNKKPSRRIGEAAQGKDEGYEEEA